MTEKGFSIRPGRPRDGDAISALEARAFGPGRFTRTAYRVREAGGQVSALCLTAWRQGRLAGSIRFTEVTIGGAGGALLLGPLAVEPALVGQGCGRALLRAGLEQAREASYRLVVLVGDLAYYEALGFATVPAGQIVLPGPVDPARLLAAELEPKALVAYRGTVRAMR